MGAENTVDIGAALIILLPGLFGMWTHWRLAFRQGRVSGTFFDYLFADNPQGTGVTVAMFLSAMAGMNWLGLFDQVHTDYIVEALRNWQIYKPAALAVIASATTGYTFDSRWNGSK